MGKLEGKVAIVTGATSGMGRDSAKLFAAEGAKVVVTGRNEERAKAVVDDIKAAGGEAIFVIADMANLDDVQKIFDATMDEYGTIDVLFNNAGVLSMSPLMEVTLEEWTKNNQ
jgi:NAD(P)-dependent dehydrogenase (short-subunit alcohol dehydrogenase family)